MNKDSEKSKYVIDVRGLKKSFADRVIIEDLNIQIKSGEIYGFIGPNGQGKTTTMRMLCGLLTPDEGEGHCLGYDIRTQTEEIKFYTGYMPQFFSLYKDLTVYENLRLMAELYGILHRKEKIYHSMELVGIADRENQIAGTLSGGFKQKLTLAAALLHDTLFLLLDEPTASVDPKSRKEIWEVLHNLSSRGITIFVTSHNLDEIQHCNRIAYLNKGKILISGTSEEIITQAGLSTWSVTGTNLTLLAKQLEVTPGVGQVIVYSDSIHVSSQNEEELRKAILPFRENPNFQWQTISNTLEDVFVWFTRQ